jgi:RNA polymerase sigma-70 factor (ECF subfamily)
VHGDILAASGHGVTHEGSTSLTLLQRIRAGDNAGWRQVFDLYAPLVNYWCRRWGVDGADADDISQEVFYAAAQSIGNFRRETEGDTFRGWLRGITRHKVVAYWRARENQPESCGGSEARRRLEEIPEPEAAPASDEAAQMSALFHRAVRLLQGEFENRTWQAFWGTAVDGQPAAAIGAELGMTANAVRMAKSRVLHRLREALGDLVE